MTNVSERSSLLYIVYFKFMEKQKISLVLSMGGARGIAHIGVIETLLEYGYEIASITGSSMGAMVGAMYATGRMTECKEWLCSWDKRKMFQLADLTLSRDGLVKGDRFIRELKQIVPDVPIESLPLPYAALATDILSEQEVKFTSGSLFDAIRASISIPMVFRPVRTEGRILVDGGLLNPLPLRHAIRPRHSYIRRSACGRRCQCSHRQRQTPPHEPLQTPGRIVAPDDAANYPLRHRTLQARHPHPDVCPRLRHDGVSPRPPYHPKRSRSRPKDIGPTINNTPFSTKENNAFVSEKHRFLFTEKGVSILTGTSPRTFYSNL